MDTRNVWNFQCPSNCKLNSDRITIHIEYCRYARRLHHFKYNGLRLKTKTTTTQKKQSSK